MGGESPSGRSESTLAGLAPGSLIAGYRVESRIGTGGMAMVFRAYDEALGRTVALKILAAALADDTQFRERFIRESRAVAAVDHPHIIPVYAAGEAGGMLYLAMRFVPGGDLRAVLEREGPLSGDRTIALLSPIASALDVAHADGLVHRDVKPANILVDARSGRPEHPYLSDFGLVKGAMASAGLTRAGQFLGTPNYVAPEQISGEPARPQTDQYSLACVAYTLLTGTLPFARDETMAVLWAHMYDAPPSLVAQRPDQPSAVDEVLARALAKSPEDRYGTCEELIGALRTAFAASPQALPGAGTGALPAPTPRQPEQDSAAPSESLPSTREPVPPSALSLPPGILPASPLPASHPGTAIALPPPRASSGVEEPADKPHAAHERAPDEGIDLPVPQAPQPEPEDDSEAALATVTSARLAIGARDSDQPAAADAVSSDAGADTEPPTDGPPAQPSQKHPRRRHRMLIITTAATVAVVAGVGALLAAHPWTHPVRPLQPTGLRVKSETTSSLEIAWSGPASGSPPADYEILRNGTELTTVPGSITSYTDKGLAPDTAYSFQVIAATGNMQSPASATLTSARTTKPALSAAVLNWYGQVTEKVISIKPAEPGWSPQPGSSTQDIWSFSADCWSGPCDATLSGTFEGYSFTAALTPSGTTYAGTAKLSNDYNCNGNKSDTYSATLAIKITVNAAHTQGDIWTATSFTGNETEHLPAAYTCYAATSQVDVNSS